MTVGHSLLVIVYHALGPQMSYKELGDKQNLEAQRKRLINRLEATGVKVTVEEIAVAHHLFCKFAGPVAG